MTLYVEYLRDRDVSIRKLSILFSVGVQSLRKPRKDFKVPLCFCGFADQSSCRLWW